MLLDCLPDHHQDGRHNQHRSNNHHRKSQSPLPPTPLGIATPVSAHHLFAARVTRRLSPLLEKGLCAHHIVHRALHEYLRAVEIGSIEFNEMLDIVKELLVEM